MDNRILLIGDSLWGEEPCLGDQLAQNLLVEFPQKPLQIAVLSGLRITLNYLQEHCAHELIGRTPSIVLLDLGRYELLNGANLNSLLKNFEHVIHELLHNTNTQILLCTQPTLGIASSSQLNQLQALNQFLRNLATQERIHLADLELEFSLYQQSQSVRNEQMRSLMHDDGELSSLGRALWLRILTEITPLSGQRFLLSSHI